MSEPTENADQLLLPLTAPQWLVRAVSPWTVVRVALWRAGLMLDLRSSRARIPVLVRSSEAGGLALSILDPRIPQRAGEAFVQAVHARLVTLRPLRDWLGRLQAAAQRLDASELPVVEAWRRWPQREGDPGQPPAPLPAGLVVEGWPRDARAAVALHQLAQGDALAALTSWVALPPASAAASFVERVLDVAALGLLGRRDEASEAAAGAESYADGGEHWLALARAYEALDRPEPAAAAFERVLAARRRDWDRLRLARVRGGFAPDEPIPRPSAGSPPEAVLSFARELTKILADSGRDDDIVTVVGEILDGALAPPPLDLTLEVARRHLWRGEGEQARAWLRRCPAAESDAQAQLIHAALAVLEGHSGPALEQLASIPDTSTAQLERLLWQTEAHLALGQLDEALARVDRHIVLENSLCAYLLKLLVLVRRSPTQAFLQSLASRTFLDALAIDVLPTLRPQAEVDAALGDPHVLAALVRGILDEMGGNRGPTPTWCRRGPAGVRLERVRTRPSGRDAAVANLIRVRTDPLEAVFAGFDAVAAEYPHSPHPCTYRGELEIWLGRYADALASFAAADERALTRWAYVGRAAAYDLLGDADAADHWTVAGLERFGEIETATTYVYRGERRRKLGDWAGARHDLEIALAHKTRRVGARINLALVHAALGEREQLGEQLARIEADAPAYVFEAGGRAGEPLTEARLLRMLELMVGNRSSFLHTMIDTQGRFRVVPEPARWIAFARLSLGSAREAVAKLLAATLLPNESADVS